MISDTLVSAYLNEGWMPDGPPMASKPISAHDLDRRRQTAAGIMTTIRDAAIRADDGTVTWIAPVISPTGWAVQPLSNDIYNGMSGVAVAVAGYLLETTSDRADEVSGLDSLLDALLRTLRAIEDQDELLQRGPAPMRPDAPGGYVGLGSLIWAWLLLGRMGIPGLGSPSAPASHAGGRWPARRRSPSRSRCMTRPGTAGRTCASRAASSCWRHGLGWNHTLCHGDLGVWEVIDRAMAAGAGPPGLDRTTLDARIVGGLGEHGPVSGLARDALTPGLLPGIGGMAYQLLRLHPRCPLPSVLLPDPGAASQL